MTNEEIIQRGQLINDETEPAQNTSERVGGVIKGIGQNLADKDTAIAAQAARNGYYQCTVNGTTLAVTAPGFTLPAHGGNIRIKMSAPATGASTLNINGTGAKALLYNGLAVSSANTWEQNEIISVFYDGTSFMASNSQGGGSKIKVSDDNFSDLSFSDEYGYDLVKFSNGHIRTKNFNSAEVPTRNEVDASHPVSTENDDMNDFSIQDGNGFSIVDFSNGHVKTKNFDSSKVVIGAIRKSNTLIYRRQLDNDFIHNNVGIIGNWVKRTLNSTPVVSTYSWGSQLVFKVRGTASVIANFILNGSSNSTIGVRVDGGEWSIVNVTESVTIADSLVSDEEHIIQIMTLRSGLSSTTYTQGTGCINFVSLTVAEGAVITPLTTYNRKILFIGDSITAGAGLLETWKTYSYKLADMLFAQPIQSCVESSGLTTSTTSWVPHVPDVLKNLISGRMNFINEPDIVFIMIGTNDGGVSASVFTPAYIALLQYIRDRFGGCHIFACSPFNGTHLADTEAATLEFDNITWIGTSDLAGTYTTLDGTHPDAAGAITCANFCFEKINEVIDLNYFN